MMHHAHLMKIFLFILALVPFGTVYAQEAQVFDIQHLLENGYIASYELDSDKDELYLDVITDSAKIEKLTIILPRELIDSKFNNKDTQFHALIDGKDVQVLEIGVVEVVGAPAATAPRLIQIFVPPSGGFITIIGTESHPNAVVVPEFSTIAMLTLVSGVVLAVTISRKFKMIP